VRDELWKRGPRLGVFGRRLHWLSTASSTNDVAARLAELGAEEGTTVVAETQTAGRGRMGRSWFSPPGAGLYVSIVLRPPPVAQRPVTQGFSPVRDPSALLTLAAGVALAEGIQAGTGLLAEIKWPNDLLVGKRKLAGILAEAAAQGGALQFIVLGLGLNLRPAAYPPELAERATSVEAELNRPADRAVILAEILAACAARYADLLQGRFDAILSAWRERAPSLRGSLVEWDSPRGLRRGRAEDIDGSGALIVRADGRTERLIAGEVRWI
jgi:BirA family transcriptional regulator, biotin operon repressor / biotin---[acetyl-CoA-carboxylase] ligase